MSSVMKSRRNASYTMKPVTIAKKKTTAPCTCGCSACGGVQCMERPRYFAGQLLTEADLNSEQAYVLAKNRLHNRYLHGWGVVCGLEVVCGCDGKVNVQEGYAIDPCGNDIIVCSVTPFDVLAEIQKCIDAERRREDDCRKWVDPNADCHDIDQEWCVTIEYQETEAKPTLPLRQEKKASCNCGCGGSKSNGKSNGKTKSGCGCGCGAGDATPAPPSNVRSPACEPTRIFEGFKLGVVPQPVECQTKHLLKGSTTPNIKFAEMADAKMSHLTSSKEIIALGGILGSFIPPYIQKSPWFRLMLAANPDDSLLSVIVDTTKTVFATLDDYLTKDDQTLFQELLRNYGTGGAATSQEEKATETIQAPDIAPQAPPDYGFCCRFRAAIQALYDDDPMNVRCQGFDCPPCAGDTYNTNYTKDTNYNKYPDNYAAEKRVRQDTPINPLNCLLEAFFNYLVDAICLKLVPPCPPAPCDDRLILACVTIRGGEVVHICNFECRHYAGSFNSLRYWTSAVPIAALIGALIREICCSDNALKTLLALGRLAKSAHSKTMVGTPVYVEQPAASAEGTTPAQPAGKP